MQFSIDRRQLLWSFNLLCIVIAIAAICHIATFPIFDFDFWWHVKAGDIMRDTGWIIETDPFSYVRTGQPYLATHEWLAQVIFSFVFGWFGSMGIIVLRWILVCATFIILLSIDWKRAWMNVWLAILGAAIALPGFMDRPQLFSFVLFALFLRLCIAYIDRKDRNQSTTSILATMLIAQLLWVNMHGGAAAMGCILFACLFIDRAWHERSRLMTDAKRELLLLIGIGIALGIILLIASPTGFGNAMYLWSLMHDNTATLIKEWLPRPWDAYLSDYAILWMMAIAAIALSRTHLIFSILSLLILGYFSRASMRHEMLLCFLLLGITFWQLRSNERWQNITAWPLRRPIIVALLFIILLPLLWRKVKYEEDALKQYNNLYGFGTFEPAKSAADFLEAHEISGNIFQDNWGGYLSYRFWPQRKIFYDGRNVEFGYDFMAHVSRAGQDSAAWQTLDDRYSFTHALLYYDPFTDTDSFPYINHLSTNPDWTLVYLDDWTALYLKNSAEHAALIESYRYTLLTPLRLERRTLEGITTPEQARVLETELKRVLTHQPNSLKARWLLAHLYTNASLYDDAENLLQQAIELHPRRYVSFELLGLLFVAQEKWKEAGETLEHAAEVAGQQAEGFNYAYLAEIFAKAGDNKKAAYYKKKAMQNF